MARPVHRADIVELDLDGSPGPIRSDPNAAYALVVMRAGPAVVGEELVPRDSWARFRPPADARARALDRRMRAALAQAVYGEAALESADPPKVTLVVSSRGRGERLEACLEGVSRLETPPQETLVLVADAHLRVVGPVCSRKGVSVESHEGGLAEARNRFLSRAGTPLVAFVSEDHVLEPGWLSGLEAHFADELVQAAFGYELPLELGTRAQCLHRLRRERPPWPLRAGRTGPMPAFDGPEPGAFVVRTSILDEVGAFDPRLGPGMPAGSGEVGNLLSRTLGAGYRIVCDPARVSWRTHPSSWRELAAVRFTEVAGAAAAGSAGRWWVKELPRELLRALVRDPRRASPSLLAVEACAALVGPFQARRSRPARAVSGPGPARPLERAVRVTGSEHPELSLSIASHNRRDSLRSVLVALGDQTYPYDRYEVAVVLDGCTDGSSDMVSSLDVPYALRAVPQPQRGLAAARNRGMQEAEHSLAVFLDDDLVPVETFLEAHAAAHREATGPRVVVGHSPPARLGTSFWAQEIRAWWEDRFRRMQEPLHRWSFIDFADGNLSTRISTLRSIDGWDEGFTRRQDWELAIRLLEAGTTFAYSPEATGWHHFDPSLSTAIANRRAEGASDVAFAARHPRWRGQLQLAQLAAMFRESEARRRLIAASFRHPRAAGAVGDAALAALGALERGGLRTAWSKMLGRLMMLQYLLGVTDASSLDHFADIAAELGDDAGERVTIRLDRPGPAVLPDRAGPLEVCLADGDRILACVPGTPPMRQWDWDELFDRLIEAAGDDLRSLAENRGPYPRAERR